MLRRETWGSAKKLHGGLRSDILETLRRLRPGMSRAWEVLSPPNRRPRQRARPSDQCGEVSLHAQDDSVQAAGELSESAVISIQPRSGSIAQWCFAGQPSRPVQGMQNSWILVPLLLDGSGKLDLSAQIAWRTHEITSGWCQQ